MSCVLAWNFLPVARAVEEEPVAAVQAFLRQERLYVGPVNGILDGPTMAGVRRYQILRGLRASGRLDDETLRRMLVPPAPVAELTEADRQLLSDLARMPVPDPGAEHRRPLPPLDQPLPVAEPAKKAQAEQPVKEKRKRVKTVRARRSSSWSASD